jgi:hypothetical protein
METHISINCRMQNAVIACTGDARPMEEYADMVQSDGFIVDWRQDLPESAASFLMDINGKLLVAEVAIGLVKLPISRDALDQAKQTLPRCMASLVRVPLATGLCATTSPDSQPLGSSSGRMDTGAM